MKIGDTIYYMHEEDDALVPKLGTLLHWGQETYLHAVEGVFIPVLYLCALVCDQDSGEVRAVQAERVMTRESRTIAQFKNEE